MLYSTSLRQVIGSTTPSVCNFTATCMEATTLLCFDSDRFAAIINDSASAERIAKKVRVSGRPKRERTRNSDSVREGYHTAAGEADGYANTERIFQLPPLRRNVVPMQWVGTLLLLRPPSSTPRFPVDSRHDWAQRSSLHLLLFSCTNIARREYSVTIPCRSYRNPPPFLLLPFNRSLCLFWCIHHAQEFLKCNPVFSTLADAELNKLEALFTTIKLDDNQLLCEEGSRADHVYVVKRGFLRVFKAFLPIDGQVCPRRPSGATTTSRSAPSRPNTALLVNNDDDTQSRESGGIRLRHFDLGEIGPKDILGENGVLRPEMSSSPSPATTTGAAAPALATATPALPLLPEISSSNQEAGAGLPQSKETPTDGRRPDGDIGGGQDASLPVNAATPEGSSQGVALAPQKTVYIVSAAASGGRAEVYVAKTHRLKRLQTDGFRYCWKTAQRLHQARTQAWSAAALAQQLQRQMKWEAIKRDVVSQA